MPDFFSYNIIHFIVLIACMFKEMKYICNWSFDWYFTKY
jgi:hypothetical protein